MESFSFLTNAVKKRTHKKQAEAISKRNSVFGHQTFFAGVKKGGWQPIHRKDGLLDEKPLKTNRSSLKSGHFYDSKHRRRKKRIFSNVNGHVTS